MTLVPTLTFLAKVSKKPDPSWFFLMAKIGGKTQ